MATALTIAMFVLSVAGSSTHLIKGDWMLGLYWGCVIGINFAILRMR